MKNRCERGAALVLAMMAVVVLAAVAASLAIISSTELRIAVNYVDAMELRYVAEAALEATIEELAASADWNELLAGPATSILADGAPGGLRRLTDGSTIDLDDLSSQAIGDNPTFRPFAFVPAQRLQPAEDLGIDAYVVVWIGDDPEENPAMLAVRAEAFGASGMRRMLAARVLRTEAGAVKLVSWHELR